MDISLKIPVKTTVVLTIAIVLALIFTGKPLWGIGFLTGSVWSIINFLLTVDILSSALLQGNKKRIRLIIFLKFPLLYVTLFFIFISRAFPPLSILAALPLILITTGVSRIWPK
jgi:hypothetical protein